MLPPHLLNDLGFREVSETVGAEARHGLGQLAGPDEIERSAHRARLLPLGRLQAELDPLPPRRLIGARRGRLLLDRLQRFPHAHRRGEGARDLPRESRAALLGLGPADRLGARGCDHLGAIKKPLGHQLFITLRPPEVKPARNDILAAATTAGRAPKEQLVDHEEPLERAIAGLGLALGDGLDLLEHIGHDMRPGRMKRLRDLADLRARVGENHVDRHMVERRQTLAHRPDLREGRIDPFLARIWRRHGHSERRAEAPASRSSGRARGPSRSRSRRPTSGRGRATSRGRRQGRKDAPAGTARELPATQHAR